MDRELITLWLSIGGFFLALCLAIIRMIEFFRDRAPRLRIVTRLTSDEQEGNDIILLNASTIPANVYQLDLVWAKLGPFGKNCGVGRRVIRSEYSDDNFANVTVPSHSQHPLNFRQGEHFAWGAGINDNLYLRIWLVGADTPLWFWVTGP
jgi:hypothetical protein